VRLVLRDQGTSRRCEVTVDGRDHRRRAADLEAEVLALRAEVRRLRAELARSAWLDRVAQPYQALFQNRP
jgi:hypothetical protein